jgi:hypothetical protein
MKYYLIYIKQETLYILNNIGKNIAYLDSWRGLSRSARLYSLHCADFRFIILLMKSLVLHAYREVLF